MRSIKPHNVGPDWLKVAKPEAKDVKSRPNLAFQHVPPAHRAPVLRNAKTCYEAAISAQ